MLNNEKIKFDNSLNQCDVTCLTVEILAGRSSFHIHLHTPIHLISNDYTPDPPRSLTPTNAHRQAGQRKSNHIVTFDTLDRHFFNPV